MARKLRKMALRMSFEDLCMRLIKVAFAALLATTASARVCAAETSAKFVLDWVVQGTHVPFSNALSKKMFDKEGLKVSIDRGYGSVDTISKIGNGVYDFGFADPNLILKYNNDNPDAKVTMVLLVYDGSESAIVARKTSGIVTPRDLEGKKIAAPPSDNTRQIFPVYAKAAGFDGSKVEWVSAQANVRDTLLVGGQVDAVAALETTVMLDLQKLSANPEDYVSLRFAKYLPELLGAGIIVSQKTIKERPDLVRAFVKAIIAGEQDAMAHPETAVPTLAMLNAMVDLKAEAQRFASDASVNLQNPALKAAGLGAVDKERLRKSTEYMSQTFNVPMPADLSEIYDQRFLPPLAERQL
jgi:NitT/TauT family transport system substrate-binding protein